MLAILIVILKKSVTAFIKIDFDYSFMNYQWGKKNTNY